MEVDAKSAVYLVIAAQRVVPLAERIVLDLNLAGDGTPGNLDPLLAQTEVERMLVAAPV